MKIRSLNTNKLFLLTIMTVVSGTRFASAQSVYQPYTYQFYQKFSADLYSTQTRMHTSIKPYIIDSALQHTYDSLMNVGKSSNRLLNEHLIDTKNNKGNSFYGDILPDFVIGQDLSGSKTIWDSSIGAQIGGTISPKFSYYGSFYVNRAMFPDYISSYTESTAYIPGQGMDRTPNSFTKDWLYSTFILSYTPAKFVNFTLGKDKNFIGDGYRSMLLSDFAPNYPFLRTTVTVGNVRYMAMYAYMANPNAPTLPYGDTRNKWGYFQYFDWNISNRISVGIFQNVMETTRDANGQQRGFNPSLAMPIVFLVPLDNIDNNPGKNVLGLTAKYKIFDKTIIYGQFALNEFHSKDFFSGNGASVNKSGYQVGIRGADLFHVKGLNYLAEFNSARPFTYSSFDQSSNYSNDYQPLAHPFGANFREWLAILNYSVGRFDLQGQLNYAYYGLDVNGQDYGQNIFEPYNNAVQQYGNYPGQGIRTDFYYAEGRLAYILNPKYNLRIEAGAIYRNTQNSLANSKTAMITIGLRSSFRNIYNDF